MKVSQVLKFTALAIAFINTQASPAVPAGVSPAGLNVAPIPEQETIFQENLRDVVKGNSWGKGRKKGKGQDWKKDKGLRKDKGWKKDKYWKKDKGLKKDKDWNKDKGKLREAMDFAIEEDKSDWREDKKDRKRFGGFGMKGDKRGYKKGKLFVGMRGKMEVEGLREAVEQVVSDTLSQAGIVLKDGSTRKEKRAAMASIEAAGIDLQQIRSDAAQDFLSKAVEEGTISSEDAEKMLDIFEEKQEQRKLREGMDSAIETAIAEALNVSVEEVEDLDRRDIMGKFEAAGLNLKDVKDSAMADFLEDAVSEGTITQEEADKINERNGKGEQWRSKKRGHMNKGTGQGKGRGQGESRGKHKFGQKNDQGRKNGNGRRHGPQASFRSWTSP